MTKVQCSKCEKYRRAGHNFCRMCGFHLTEGFVQRARVADAYRVEEKFCGYCGVPAGQCRC